MLGVVTALSAVALAGAGFPTVPTHSQVTLALVGSVLAGCLGTWMSWPAGLSAQKKSVG